MYILINFTPIGVAGLLKITNGANILDFEFGYTSDQAYTMITNLGEDGRSFYLTRIIPLDFPFPFAYMICYVGWIALLVKNIASLSVAKYLILVPFCAMIFDWIENIGIFFILNTYPELSVMAVQLASISGILKILFSMSSILIIFISLTLYLLQKKRRTRM